MMLRRLLILALLFLTPTTSWALTDLYVNTDTGSGSTCTVGSPCATLSAAVAAIPGSISDSYVIHCSGSAADATAADAAPDAWC